MELGVGTAPPAGQGPLPTALLPPAPLAATFAVAGVAKPLPNLGWACTGPEDAAAAINAGALLLDTSGDASTEAALTAVGEGTPGSTPFIVSAVQGPDRAKKDIDGFRTLSGGAAALECITARLGGTAPDLVLLPAAGWASGAAAEIADAGVAVGLVCDTGAAAAVAQVNEILATAGAPTLAALKLQLDPTTAKIQRSKSTTNPQYNLVSRDAPDKLLTIAVLIGLCKRRGIRILAADPLGGADCAAALKERVLAGVEDGTTDTAAVLLGWCIGRGIVALPSAADGVAPEAVLGKAVLPIDSTTRSGLDAAASQDGLRAAAVTE